MPRFAPDSPSITVSVEKRLTAEEIKAYAARAVGRTVLAENGSVLVSPSGAILPARFDNGDACPPRQEGNWNRTSAIELFLAIIAAYNPQAYS